MKKRTLSATIVFCILCLNPTSFAKENTMNALIIDGQNNHRTWPKTTVMIKQYLEQSDLFTVDVYRTKPTWHGETFPDYYKKYSEEGQVHVATPEHDPTFKPDFTKYDVIISNFGNDTAPWPLATQKALETFMKNGGGFVSVHAADNSFPKWVEFNKMIGVGGWGGRNQTAGPHLYYNDAGELVHNTDKGKAGSHGNRYELEITKRADHPILSGLPDVWMHTKDECYSNMRGPAENMTILATAHCLKEERGNGLHEPALMVINYGKGRIFHTTLGHDDVSVASVGFITTLQRGAEWAATGNVTQQVPEDFPTKNEPSVRVFKD